MIVSLMRHHERQQPPYQSSLRKTQQATPVVRQAGRKALSRAVTARGEDTKDGAAPSQHHSIVGSSGAEDNVDITRSSENSESDTATSKGCKNERNPLENLVDHVEPSSNPESHSSARERPKSFLTEALQNSATQGKSDSELEGLGIRQKRWHQGDRSRRQKYILRRLEAEGRKTGIPVCIKDNAFGGQQSLEVPPSETWSTFIEETY
ncbi:hypothetical protein F5Y19DRAFT_459340 [Xylariaceae sp. FL1651]|nr:hypothetical protein F5Y19DRAFT_459340 [Xylariaceae sp. FL1651]